MVKDPSNNLDILVQDYNQQLRDPLDKHAPLITKTVRHRHVNAWYDEDLKSLKLQGGD